MTACLNYITSIIIIWHFWTVTLTNLSTDMHQLLAMSSYQLMYWSRSNTNKHSHTYTHKGPAYYTNIQFYNRSKTKALKIQGFCCSPSETCISTLTHKDLFSPHLNSMLWSQLFWHSRVCTLTAPLLCRTHFNIYSSHLLKKSTDHEDSSFRLGWVDVY